MIAYNLAANLLFEYSYFTFESYVVLGLCEIGLALVIEVLHTFWEGGSVMSQLGQSSVSFNDIGELEVTHYHLFLGDFQNLAHKNTYLTNS